MFGGNLKVAEFCCPDSGLQAGLDLGRWTLLMRIEHSSHMFDGGGQLLSRKREADQRPARHPFT